jgi:oxygen-independent coproporphyrinogen-3 oxidase
MTAYLKALAKEIRARLLPLGRFHAPSLYFGGGTPSLVPAKDLAGVLAVLGRYARWNDGSEITLEADPNTFGKAKARAWRKMGINRISIGVQSFNAASLRRLGRTHTAEDCRRSFRLLRSSGFQNINLDLMYGLPQEGARAFLPSIRETVRLRPEHVSLYQLDISARTPFGKMLRAGRLDLAPEKDTARMYRTACRELGRAGYRHYELQNFARPGFESTHNRRYWNHEEFLGFGVGAFSYLNGLRFGHGKSLRDYLAGAGRGDFRPELCEKITEQLKMKESLILGLRLADGIDLEVLERARGIRVSGGMIRRLDDLVSKKLARRRDRHYRLSGRGELLSESVASALV